MYVSVYIVYTHLYVVFMHTHYTLVPKSGMYIHIFFSEASELVTVFKGCTEETTRPKENTF